MNPGSIYLKKAGLKGHETILRGTVIAVYEKFFIVDFGIYKEAFSNIKDEGK